jgi:hypothetical protein
LLGVVASCCAALVCAGAAASLPIVGAAEDRTKYADDGGTALFDTMKARGLSSNRISVYWNYQQPTVIQEQPFLSRVVDASQRAGFQLVFAIYADPRIPGGVTAVGQNPDAFCNYAALIAATYPSVTKIIVGNEPNQKRFWQPQPHSGTAFEPVQAKCYDALKAVNPKIDVIGVGLSPRGNDQPTAVNNASSSPVRFIYDFATAYRLSGRTKPLFDEFAFHCYPNVNTDSVSKGYQWPNIGCINFNRLKQALWDGFNGTAQPTPLEGATAVKAIGGGAATVVVDETGWQAGVNGKPGYSGAENVPTISDTMQAQYYAQLVGIAACDPSITAFHFLYFLDSASLADFQSGMETVDGTPRASANAVQNAIVSGCARGRTSWRHSTTVAGAKAKKGISPRGKPAIAVNATEDFSYSIVATAKGKSATVKGNGKAYVELDAVLPPGFKGGKAKVTLKAWANPSRTSTLTVAT